MEATNSSELFVPIIRLDLTLDYDRCENSSCRELKGLFGQKKDETIGG
jgi:hypothetical protein